LPSSSTPVPVPRELPQAYGEDALVLLVRDPWWGFAYWEVTEALRRRAEQALGSEMNGAERILRVYDVTGVAGPAVAISHFDAAAGAEIGSLYLHLNAPSHEFIAELGFRA